MSLDPREQALILIEEGIIDSQTLVEMCLYYMSWEEIEDMFRLNNRTLWEEDIF